MRNPPKIVEFEITLACNLRCIHCYCEAGQKSPFELSADEIKKLMDDLKGMGIWALDIVGGEPLLRNDLYDLLEYAKGIGLRVMINTNGTLMSENTAKRLKDVYPDLMVGVSLDGPDPETNDFVRGRGSFEKAVRGIRVLVENGFDPVILNVINRRNWKRFEDMIGLAKSLGVDKIYVDRFIPVGRGVVNRDKLDMSDSEWIEAIEHVREVIEKYENDMTFYVEENITGDLCSAGVTHASILANGWVVPCGHFRYNSEFYMGNVRERPFSEIWNSFDPSRFFPTPEPCRSCDFLNVCGGGCKAVSYHRYGDVSSVDIPICSLRKRNQGFHLKNWG